MNKRTSAYNDDGLKRSDVFVVEILTFILIVEAVTRLDGLTLGGSQSPVESSSQSEI
jgi:hypothetical protein